MGIEIIFKIAAVGLITAIVCQILKKADREDIGVVVSLAGLVIVLLMVVSMVGELFETLKNMFGLY